MQTITVAKVASANLSLNRFRSRVRNLTLNREEETLTAAYVETLRSRLEAINGLATAIVRRRKTSGGTTTIVRDGHLETVDANTEIIDYARAWLGHNNYVLFCFWGGFPGGKYVSHRLFVARTLTTIEIDEHQDLVVPVRYDLNCVRTTFPGNIWEQNFLRTDAIRRGRIRGFAMQNDPLYRQFEHIETYIGVEIPITGSQQLVKVFADGRLQFMALQPAMLEDPSTRETALHTVLQVLDRLSGCES